MSITVHIERLVLHDLPATSSQGPLVQAAVEAELTRLLADRGLDPGPIGVVPYLSAGFIELSEHGKPAQLGHQIAQAVHGALTPAPALPRQPPASRGARR
jgi:hypothetical protein